MFLIVLEVYCAQEKIQFSIQQGGADFSTADFLSFSQFSLYYWGKNNKLSWSWRSPSNFAHHTVPFLTRSKWSTYWALLDRASTKVRSTMMFFLTYLLADVDRVTAVPFLGWDLCRKQSQINNFLGCFFLLLQPQLSWAPGWLELQMGPSSQVSNPAPDGFYHVLTCFHHKAALFYTHCDGKSEQRPLHPQKWEKVRRKEKQETELLLGNAAGL